MEALLWTGQVLLALVFAYSGMMKSTQDRAFLVRIGQTGVEDLPYGLIRFIGIIELLGVLGILLPWWTGIAPVLTPVTALGFGLIMLLAAPVHYRRRESRSVVLNIAVLLLSLFVAILRLRQC